MIKKFLSFVLTFTLLISSVFINTSASSNSYNLPETGQVIYGFEVTGIYDDQDTNSNIILFEHQKSGAKLVYFQNDDIERSFDISFRTPAFDNTGVNHILEHCSVSGSEKYPSKDIFFNMSTQTYNTFVNAFTYHNFTSYPVSTLSEKQLLKLADVYMDGVFNPLVKQEKRIFDREAWRYELEDKQSELKINGTVYNEMQGNNNDINVASYYNTLEALFPNSILSKNSGGTQESIPKLTYEKLLSTHLAYYHPSNALIVLYGKLDYTTFLKYFDGEYLSKYDKKYIEIETGIKDIPEKNVESIRYFPALENSKSENASLINYAFPIKKFNAEEIKNYETMASVLNNRKSPVIEKLKELFPDSEASIYLETETSQPILIFSISGVNKDDMAKFRSAVDDTINHILYNGFDSGFINEISSDSVAKKCTNFLLSDSQQELKGVYASLNLADNWAKSGNLDSIKLENSDNHSINTKDLLNCLSEISSEGSPSALVATAPLPGLSEKNYKDSLDKLAKIKAAMTNDEITDLVNKTREFKAWTEKEEPTELIKNLQAITIKDLPEEIQESNVTDVINHGVRVITSPIDLGDIYANKVYFNSRHIPLGDLHYLKLCCYLIGNLGTKTHEKNQVKNLIDNHIPFFTLMPEITTINKNISGVVSCEWMGTSEEAEMDLDLIKEILTQTDFSDLETIKSNVSKLELSLRSPGSYSQIGDAINRGMAGGNISASYNAYMNGTEYYEFIAKVKNELEKNPNNVISDLIRVYKKMFIKNNLITSCVGNQETCNKFQRLFPSWGSSFNITKAENPVYSFPKYSKSEAFVTDDIVQYNIMGASYNSLGITSSGKLVPLTTAINDLYLVPTLRHKLGAYGANTYASGYGLVLYSYRDPNVRETFDAYKALPDALMNISLTQEDLDRYIIGTYSAYSKPESKFMTALSTIYCKISGITKESRLRFLSQIKSATTNDFYALAETLKSVVKKGFIATVGSSSKIKECQDLYKTIINSN